MKMCWFPMFLLVLAINPTYLKDHRDDDDNPCEDALWDQWGSLRLDHGKKPLECVCVCHADGCVYIAVSEKEIPVFWVYRIHHERSTVLSDQELLKNIWVWYIPAKVIRNIMRLKTSPKVIQKRSFPITHIVSGVIPAKNIRRIGKSSWRKQDDFQWIAYKHTGNAGDSFEGAAILDGEKWKWTSIEKLANLMSGSYSPSKMGLEVLQKKVPLKQAKGSWERRIKNSQDERTFTTSPLSGFDVEVKMDGQATAAHKNSDKQDSVDGSDGGLNISVVSGETLHVSQDKTVPEESWQDLAVKTGHDLIHQHYELEVSMIDSEDGDQESKHLEILGESESLQKSRPQQEVVSASLMESQKILTTTNPGSIFTDFPEQTYISTSQTPTPSPTDTNKLQKPDVTISTTSINTECTEDTKSTTDLPTNKKYDIATSQIPQIGTDKPTDSTKTTKNSEESTTTPDHITECSEEPKMSTNYELQTTKETAPVTDVFTKQQTAVLESTLPTAIGKTTPNVETWDVESLQKECMKAGTEDPSKCCYGLIHRSTVAFKRCLEKIRMMQKLRRKSQKSHYSSTISYDYTEPDFRSRRALQSIQDNINTRKNIGKTQAKDEENEHFYYFDGKLRVKDNHSGPRVDAK